MKKLQSVKYGKIIPVKLIGNKIVKIKNIPNLESKKLKEQQIDESVSCSTEPSIRIISNRSAHNDIVKLSVELSKKYKKLIEDVKIEKEMIGTVEENIGDYPNYDPFGPSSNGHTQSHISNTKKVFFKTNDENKVVFKVLDSNLFLTIYNKAPPEKKFFRKSELNRIIKIQNKFKGIYKREVEKCVDRLKAEECILETLLLLVGRAYDNAMKKITFKKLKKEFHDPFNNNNDELKFEDKIQFKLPNRYYNSRYYNTSDINKINTPKKITEKEKWI